MAHQFKRGKRFLYNDIKNTDITELCDMPRVIFECTGECLVKEGERVFVGTPVVRDDNGFYVCSSVSGKVSSLSNGRIVIDNDSLFTLDEKAKPFGVRTGKTVSELQFSEFLNVLNENSVTDPVEGRLAPFLSDAYENVRTLVLNAVTTEGSDTAPLVILENYTSKIVFAMKLLMAVMGIKRAVVAISGRSRHTLRVLSDYESDDKFIRVERLSDNYPQQNNHLVAFALSGKELSPLQKSFVSGYLILSPKTMLDIYDAFAGGAATQRAIFTLSRINGESELISVPVGTPTEYIKQRYKIEATLSSALPLSFKELPDGALIGAETTRLCELAKQKDIGAVCNKCGECIAVCPMYLYPYEFWSAGVKRAKNSGIDVCIECGLCSDICPSLVPLWKKIRELKELGEDQ